MKSNREPSTVFPAVPGPPPNEVGQVSVCILNPCKLRKPGDLKNIIHGHTVSITLTLTQEMKLICFQFMQTIPYI